MTTTESKAKNYSDIWSIKDEVIEKNTQTKKNIYDIPDESKVTNNVFGYIINKEGNFVAKFSFFIENETKDRIDLKISPDGFMGHVYNKPSNVLIGYGHPLGIVGLLDPKQSNILHLGPDQTNGDQLIISIENDELLQTRGLIIIIRSDDVMVDNLPSDIADDFRQSLKEAVKPVVDMNEIEASYNKYLKQLYNILGEQFNTKDNVPLKEEDFDD